MYAAFNFKTGKLEATSKRPPESDEFDYGLKKKDKQTETDTEETGEEDF